MKIKELVWDTKQWLCQNAVDMDASSVGLILLFGNVEELAKEEHIEYFQKLYPKAQIAGASLGIFLDHPLIATLVAFDKGWVEVFAIEDIDNSTITQNAAELVEKLPKDKLRHIFALIDGFNLNGSAFLRGARSVTQNIPLTGGISGDGNVFNHTLVVANDVGKQNRAVVIGFYGDSLHVSIGCGMGWEEFGAQRIVTRSEENVIYEIDNKPALKLYEDYLGEYIKDLPASGLRFPLNVRQNTQDKEVARVIMSINSDGSLLYSGDVPQNSIVRLMKTNVNHLIEGADLVAKNIKQHNQKTSLALTVSCSGRLSVLKLLADEELKAVQERLGTQTHLCGFYSHGEFAPFTDDLSDCKLHNQTLALSVIYED